MVTDSIADLLTRIRNAQRAGHKSVRISKSKVAVSVLEVLKQEGFISYVETKKDACGKFDELEVGLKYYASGEPCITELVRKSTAGQRNYVRTEKIPHVHSGLGIAILSTSDGVMSDREARKRKIGGELLAIVA